MYFNEDIWMKKGFESVEQFLVFKWPSLAYALLTWVNAQYL